MRLSGKVGEISADLVHVGGVGNAEAVDPLHRGLEAQAARGVQREAIVSQRPEGPNAQEAVVALAPPRSNPLPPPTSRRFPSLPRLTPAIAPALLSTSTSSGSGLLQTEAGCTPTRAPNPTAAIGGHLVKSSASGPMPTSRYCDHMSRESRISLMRAASGEPGRTPRRSGPTMAWISRH